MTEIETVKKEGDKLVKLRNLFVLNAILAFGFGLGFVLLPGTMLELYGMERSPSADLAGQLFGVELIAVGLLCWFVRDIPDAVFKTDNLTISCQLQLSCAV